MNEIVKIYMNDDEEVQITLTPGDLDPLAFALIAADLIRQVAHFSNVPLAELVNLFNEEIANESGETRYDQEGLNG